MEKTEKLQRKYKANTIELKKRMVECKLDLIRDLSKATGLSRPTVSNVVRGTTQPSTDVIDMFMQVLNLTPEEAGIIFFANDLSQQESEKEQNNLKEDQ